MHSFGASSIECEYFECRVKVYGRIFNNNRTSREYNNCIFSHCMLRIKKILLKTCLRISVIVLIT